MVPRFAVKHVIFGLLNCLLLSFLQRMTRMDMDWPWTLNRFLFLFYLIFKSQFDSVDHNILLREISYLGAGSQVTCTHLTDHNIHVLITH